MESTQNNTESHIQPVIRASLVVSLLLLFSGLGYRVIAAQLAGPVNTITMSSEALEKLPMQIGTWRGQPKPLDEAMVQATDTDAHISRIYTQSTTPGNVWLYVACGVRARDLMPHRPEVCYTGSGWTLDDRRFEELPLSHGSKLPCNVFQFSRGSLRNERIMILYYYIVDGQYCHDVSLLRSKAWRGSNKVGNVVQVELAASIPSSLALDSTARRINAFATASAPPIYELFNGTGEGGERRVKGM